jgi:hypothetical protein
MTVSGPSSSINSVGNRRGSAGNRRAGWNVERGLRRLVVVALVCFGLSSAGCLPSLAPATFPAGADTTDPGNLLGPFEGQVLDASSSRPLPSTLVWVSWRFCTGSGLCIPAGTETFSVETDADGRYRVPRLVHFPGAVRLDGVTLVAYKRGYVGYRSDRVFDEHAGDPQANHGAMPRHDFAQLRNQVRLDHFPEGGSHAAHLAFLGGSGALRSALRAEALQVSVEGGAADVTTTSPLDATALLSVEELRQSTGAIDDFTLERLEDKPRSPRYDSAHFRSTTRSEEADAAFRVYLTDSEADTDQAFDTLLADLPHAEVVDPVPAGLGARVSRGHDTESGADLYGLLVGDRAHRAVVFVTCGTALCQSTEAVESIARKVVARLPRVSHPAPEPKPAKKPNQPQDDSMKLREPTMHR